MKFTVGNNQTEQNNRLSHKVGGDLDGAEVFLVEPTRKGTDLDERIEWTRRIVELVLEDLGIKLD
jgi:hypothetical protein